MGDERASGPGPVVPMDRRPNATSVTRCFTTFTPLFQATIPTLPLSGNLPAPHDHQSDSESGLNR